MSDLCKGYPHGLGLYCDVNGHRDQRGPISLLARTYGNDLVHVCLNNCGCQNLAPEEPVRLHEVANAQLQECSMSSDISNNVKGVGGADMQPQTGDQPSSSSTCPRVGTSNGAYSDACECNDYWYGRPNNQDCHEAMLRLPDQGTTSHKLREFLAIGVRPQQIGVEDPPIRTPIILTHST